MSYIPLAKTEMQSVKFISEEFKFISTR